MPTPPRRSSGNCLSAARNDRLAPVGAAVRGDRVARSASPAVAARRSGRAPEMSPSPRPAARPRRRGRFRRTRSFSVRDRHEARGCFASARIASQSASVKRWWSGKSIVWPIVRAGLGERGVELRADRRCRRRRDRAGASGRGGAPARAARAERRAPGARRDPARPSPPDPSPSTTSASARRICAASGARSGPAGNTRPLPMPRAPSMTHQRQILAQRRVLKAVVHDDHVDAEAGEQPCARSADRRRRPSARTARGAAASSPTSRAVWTAGETKSGPVSWPR